MPDTHLRQLERSRDTYIELDVLIPLFKQERQDLAELRERLRRLSLGADVSVGQFCYRRLR